MSGGMFLIQGEELIEMTEQEYDTEEQLQKWLGQWPALLAGDQIDSAAPRKWLLVSREFGIPDRSEGSGRWFLDHLYLDQDAIPTLVEVKRSSDTRIRREVVAQMLDYAANGVAYSSIDRMKGFFDKRCQNEDLNTDEEFFAAFGDDTNIEDFWQQAKTNLEAGKIRMIFVADKIPPELLSIIEFLNKQMNPAEVLAFEIRKFGAPGVTTLIPRILGQSAEAQTKKTGSTSSGELWNEERFMASLKARADQKEIEAVNALFDWANARSLVIHWGKGGQEGTASMKVDIEGNLVKPFSLVTRSKSGSLSIHFEYIRSVKPFESLTKRQEIVRKLNEIEGVSIPLTSADKSWPTINLTALADTNAREAVLEVFDSMIHDMREAATIA